MIRTALLGVMLLLSGAIASTAPPDAPPADLAGTYACKGVNPDGNPYEALVEITRVDETYRVLWRLSDDSAILGVGIASGGVFAVSYFAGAPTVVVYKVDGKQLVGEWAMGGAEGVIYTETLTKLTATSLPRDRRPAPQERRPVRTPQGPRIKV